MLEILQFYVSGVWTWLGITIGLTVVAGTISEVISSIFKRK